MTKLIFILLFVIFVGCTENNITEVVGYDRTLVIISDNDVNSEFMINIFGAIKKEFPNVEISFIQSKDFDIYEAGYLLEISSKSYPENTAFAVIVEPGVDSRKVVYQIGKNRILAPDNGVTTRHRRINSPQNLHYIDNLNIFDNKYSDISEIPFNEFYKMAILELLSDNQMSSFGTICTNPVNLTINDPVISDNKTSGEVLLVDNFGNCETNISKSHLQNFQIGDILEIQTESSKFFVKYGTSYSSVSKNENVAFINSKNNLELSVNFSNLSNRYNLNSGSNIIISKASINIGIIRYNSSDLVDNIILGMKTTLSEFGFTSGINTNYFEINANGDITKFPELIQNLLKNDIDFAIPVSTPASQASLQYIEDNIPVIYTYVTSPEFAGLINKRANATGLSDATNFDDYLSFVKELMPDLKIAGRIYNPNEPNSAFSQDRFQTLKQFYGLNYDIQPVNSVEQISTAFEILKNNGVKSILIAADNTINLGMKQLASKCTENNIALIGDSEENAIDGALAAISVDYSILADATGKTVKNVILGISPESLPIQRFKTSLITINTKTAQSIGYSFTNQMIEKAHIIIK